VMIVRREYDIPHTKCNNAMAYTSVYSENIKIYCSFFFSSELYNLKRQKS